MRILMLILAALFAAGGTGFYLLQELRAPAAAPVAEVAPATKTVFVPATELAAGTIISADKLSRMPIEEGSITAEMIVDDEAGRELLNGSVARQTLPRGVPIARSATVQPGDRGFLAAVLPEGKRAISIPVTETAALYGLALPGDWVDLILTYTVTADDGDGGEGGASKQRDIQASETIARNIRLLALDNRVNPQVKDKDGENASQPIPSTATLQVTPRQAEEITLATSLGTLSLALNSVRDGGEGAEERLLPLALSRPAASRGPMPAATAAGLTIDADVTSLLRREVQQTVPEQVSRIQIVRGSVGSGMAQTWPVKDPAAGTPAGSPEKPAE